MKIAFVELCGFRAFRDRVRFELPAGFAVLTGRNGVGKSAVLDAVDFVLTGAINKFAVTSAKGGGPESHIWWVGSGQAEDHYVKVGFTGQSGKTLVVTRRPTGAEQTEDAMKELCRGSSDSPVSPKTLMETTLIRDELITALSIDLPGQARFETVRTAIGNLLGADFSHRTSNIVTAAKAAIDDQQRKYEAAQADLGRVLSALTEARSAAERAKDIGQALHVLESVPGVPAQPSARAGFLRQYVVGQKETFNSLQAAHSRALEAITLLESLNAPASVAQLEQTRGRSLSALEEREATGIELQKAEKALQEETVADEFASHLSALVEHGEFVGLQDGHCPLCASVRSPSAFNAAIAAAKARLAGRGRRLTELRSSIAALQSKITAQEETIAGLQGVISAISHRREQAEEEINSTRALFESHGMPLPQDSIAKAGESWLDSHQEKLAAVEHALLLLESSSVANTMTGLETRASSMRARVDQEAASLAQAQRAFDLAKQIETSVKTVANEISTERFDTVMPLLKELYRRLRPHTDWLDIDSDFGGKIRATLNFMVGDGHNVQFLFSSGQRRAAGLAFLLAIHLSRRWCNWNTLMLDDPVQHIDDYRALNLVEVLSAIRRTGRQIIVSVEDVALADLLCRRLRSSLNEPGRLFHLETSVLGTAAIQEARDVVPMPREILSRAEAS